MPVFDRGGVQLRRSADDRDTVWIHRQTDDPPFEPGVFALSLAVGQPASAGRGNTRFIEWQGAPLVRREYRRGGLIRHLSERHYLATGLARSRPLREFRLLCELEARGLPVSPAYAACRRRRGPFETGVLITRRVPGQTLASLLVSARNGELPSAQTLEAVGRCIARFHVQGVWHADLNAHNVIVDGEGEEARITLLDFDRSTLTGASRRTSPDARAHRNLRRLHRSVAKLVDAADADEVMRTLENAWRRSWRGLDAVRPDDVR